jgi:hypothetical protein
MTRMRRSDHSMYASAAPVPLIPLPPAAALILILAFQAQSQALKVVTPRRRSIRNGADTVEPGKI